LYIPYYWVMKIDFLKRNIGSVMVAVALLYVVVYAFFYDRTYYHIDNVREPMIRFLFFECMLLGAWFKQNDHKFRNRHSLSALLGTAICFGAYFVCKLALSKFPSISELQIIIQVILFVFLFFIFRTFSGYDDILERMPAILKSIITFIAGITLEIYIVQYVLIDLFRNIAVFPLNWIIITASIILAAVVLHYIVEATSSIFNKRNKITGSPEHQN